MKIDNFGDVIQDVGVIVGIIGMIIGSIDLVYVGAILCLMLNIYDLFFGKLIPLINVVLVGIFILITNDILIGLAYGTIFGNIGEVLFINIIYMTKKRVNEDPNQ